MIFPCLSTAWNEENTGKVWSIVELRALVKAKSSNSHQIISVINSIDRLGGIFVYHLEQARESLKEFFSPDSKVDPLSLVLGTFPGKENYQMASLVNEANTIALLHTTRSLYDILAQLINSLILEDRFSLERCDIKKVRNALENGEIKQLLGDLIDSTEFKYIEGFVNSVKHRQLIQQMTTLDIEQNKVGVRFSSFHYKKEKNKEEENFPSFWSDEVLIIALHVKNQIVELGILLNKLYVLKGDLREC